MEFAKMEGGYVVPRDFGFAYAIWEKVAVESIDCQRVSTIGFF